MEPDRNDAGFTWAYGASILALTSFGAWVVYGKLAGDAMIATAAAGTVMHITFIGLGPDGWHWISFGGAALSLGLIVVSSIRSERREERLISLILFLIAASVQFVLV